ncbi:ribonuclease H-like domain-containing protein [Tanacetum coccineum]
MGLESLEARIVVHEKNEAIYEENVAFLKYDVQVKDISIKELKNQLENALKEKDDLKLKLEKFETSSKNLTKLMNSQISAKYKTGLGYDSHVNESEVINSVVDSVFDSHESDGDNNQSKVSKTITSKDSLDTTASETNKDSLEKTKTVRPSAPIFEDWKSDSDDYCVVRPSIDQNKTSYAKINFVKQIENTRKSVIELQTYREAENLRKVKILGRTFTQKAAPKNSILKGKVNAAKVNNVTTAGPKAVVSVAEGNGENAVKSSACWIWRPTGNVIDHISKDSGSYTPKRFDYVDPQGNKFYLSDYQDIDGEFVAFAQSPKGGKITRKGKIRIGKLDFEDVYFVKDLKFNLLSISQMCDKKNNVLFIETECLLLSPDFKLLNESQILLKDENPEILKNFITGIENQIDHKVKAIKCDNGTEFKNRIMNEFCEMKARTMLANSKLPTTFWAEAVNTACYVQNRVLVIKPHNKTPYEHFLGRKPALSFMRPFGCHVTILNTFNHLGNQTNGHASTIANIDVGQAGKKTVPDKVVDDARKKNEVLDPAKEGDMNGQGEAADTNSTNRLNNVSSSVNIDAHGNSTYRIFTPVSVAGSSYDNLGGSISINTATLPNGDLPTDPLMPKLEDTANLQDTGIFSGAYDDEDVGAEADLNNLKTTMNVSPIPITRIHKDHLKNQIIGDINLATQIRRMTKMSEEHAMVSYINKQRRTSHKDYQNSLFAYYLSQIKPKKLIQALAHLSWVEGMQEELLQFRLQKVWRLVDLPKGKHAIRTK